MPTLTEVLLAHQGYVLDKWEQYLGVYECEMAPFISAGRPISLLEIGVQNGGSLQIWKEYLPVGSRIVGIDINPDCAQLKFDAHIELHVADGTDKGELDRVLGDNTFDVIIDDGSHRSDHIISTYRALFPRLKGGGKFVVEDLHASYWSEYGGGFRAPHSAMEFLKGLVDGLNCDHFRDTSMTPSAEIAELIEFGRSVARMTFYDSMAVIELMGAPRDTPYRQIFGGGTDKVMPLTTLFTVGACSLVDTRLASRTAARHIDRVLLGRIGELSALRQKLATIEASTSWRVTAPLRQFGRLLGKP
jgi:23S rRNA U2552 (ribose-2'-O)-methylase RlmE/FtsJ